MNQATAIPLQQTATFKLYERMAEVNAAITALESTIISCWPQPTVTGLPYSDNLRGEWVSRMSMDDNEFWEHNFFFCLLLIEHYEQELAELKQQLHTNMVQFNMRSIHDLLKATA